MCAAKIGMSRSSSRSRFSSNQLLSDNRLSGTVSIIHSYASSILAHSTQLVPFGILTYLQLLSLHPGMMQVFTFTEKVRSNINT